MIDLHCHILPNVDDGPQSVEESLAMARLAVKDGIREIVATPHSLNGIYSNSTQDIISGVAAFNEILSANGIDLKVQSGADLHLCQNMMQRIQNGEACTINNAGKFILLELPSQMVPNGVKDEIFALKLNGVTPIITHPERNAIIQHDPNVLYELIQMGALAQVTAMSVTGDFGEFIANVSEILVRDRLIHMIATDAHSSVDRPPVLSDAVEQVGELLKDYDEALSMVTAVPEAIFSGKYPDLGERSRARRSGRTA